MNEKRTELIYTMATAAAALFEAFKGMIPAETMAWILFWLAVVYMLLRTALKVAKVYAETTPSEKDNTVVASLTALVDRLGIPQDPVIPKQPARKSDPSSPAGPAG